jgi:hypothetical protein
MFISKRKEEKRFQLAIMIKGRIIHQQSLDFALRRISEVDYSKPLTYEIKLEEDSITDKQRRLFFKWMTEAANQTGYEKNDLAFEMKEKFLPSIQHSLMNGSTADERKSLTKLNKKEMIEFMDRVSRFFNIECGIALTYPEDMQRR